MNLPEQSTEQRNLPPLSSIKETQRQLGGIARSTVYLLLERGELRAVHIRARGNLRGRRMVLTESIEDYVKRLTSCKNR